VTRGVRAGAEKTGEKECVGFSNTADLGKDKVLRIEFFEWDSANKASFHFG